ncbi:hypothetical protein D9613_006647 [Agrocybe pediades]|uniref:Uncharacterized protein n=1 Tax=Agrocybe pediades TaxID=84607 RepID=A0A8H4QI27_9AGAR|nr:hypothetical protein D9613_006647 [Agrocybe pediades]
MDHGVALCDGCKRSLTTCSCSRRPATQPIAVPGYWRPSMQLQTPRRPIPHQHNPLTQIHTPQQYVAMHYYPPYVPAPAMQDPRLMLGHSQPMTPNQPPPRSSLNALPPLPSPVQPSPAPANSQKRKRGTDNGKRPSAKRSKTSSQPVLPTIDENTPPVAVPGVGPSTNVHQGCSPRGLPKPLVDYSPISKRRPASESKQAASDVWYFTRPLETKVRPVGPIQDPPPMRTKPKSPFVGCRLCPLSESTWTVWSNINGMADTIRNHLSTKHRSEWRKMVLLEKLKGWDKMPAQGGDALKSNAPGPAFTLEGFFERLVEWISVDDQSLNVVDYPELRDLLLYLNANLEDGDIPRRTKLT